MDKTIVLRPEEWLPQTVPNEVPGRPGLFVSLSAYDVPRSLSAEMDKATKTLRVVFHYLDNEDDDKKKIDDNLTFVVGKHSGKLLAIELRNVAHPIPDITLQFSKGVAQQLERATRDNQRLNYRLIEKVLDRNLAPLLSAY